MAMIPVTEAMQRFARADADRSALRDARIVSAASSGIALQ